MPDPTPSDAPSSEPSPGQVTELLVACRDGDRDAFDRLYPLLYDDLRRIARGHMRRGRRGHTLQTTGLVHEAWLKMVDQARVTARDRGHFLAISARAMRQVLVSYARRTNAAKRGSGERPLPLDEGLVAVDEEAERLVAVDRALERLAAVDPRLVRCVECRVFAGLTEDETAEALDVSLRTAQRDWKRARAWLREELGG